MGRVLLLPGNQPPNQLPLAGLFHPHTGLGGPVDGHTSVGAFTLFLFPFLAVATPWMALGQSGPLSVPPGVRSHPSSSAS